MPIEGSTPEQAADYFVQHLNTVLARTVTRDQLTVAKVGGSDKARKTNFLITFQEGRATPGEAVLQSRFGELRLYIAQTCYTEPRRRKHRLHTREYRYYLTPAGKDPLFRWEYTRFPPGQAQTICRHHFQGPLPLVIGGEELTLNDIHLPTGYVPIEEIIRFSIGELAVTPLQTDWADALEESYRRFREEFAEFGTI